MSLVISMEAVMKRTHPREPNYDPGFGYGDPVPMTDTLIVPVPSEPAYEAPAAVKIIPIPQRGPLPGERPIIDRKRHLN